MQKMIDSNFCGRDKRIFEYISLDRKQIFLCCFGYFFELGVGKTGSCVQGAELFGWPRCLHTLIFLVFGFTRVGCQCSKGRAGHRRCATQVLWASVPVAWVGSYPLPEDRAISF